MVATGRSPGRPRADTDPDTRARTLLAAQVQFGERGFAGVSMDQLAKAAGVNVRAIYHYFPSKRALFDAAAEATFETYGALVLEHVFCHEDTRSRLHGFVTMYRILYREQRHLLAMLSVIATDGVAESRRSRARRGGNAAKATSGAQPILALNEVLVVSARDRGELDPSVDAEAAIALLQTIGMGLGFATLEEDGSFLAMLDALDLLIDGTLVRDARRTRGTRPAP
jgi:AcrR family transcriptional regulator